MPRLVLVHGSVRNGAASWSAQRPLADELELVVVDRPGFPPGPVVDRVDFEEHAEWVAERLESGDHLCGHSYGGVVSLFAAARADGLASLTVVEPPAFGVAAGRPAASPPACGGSGRRGPTSRARSSLRSTPRSRGAACSCPTRCRRTWSRARGS